MVGRVVRLLEAGCSGGGSRGRGLGLLRLLWMGRLRWRCWGLLERVLLLGGRGRARWRGGLLLVVSRGPVCECVSV